MSTTEPRVVRPPLSRKPGSKAKEDLEFYPSHGEPPLTDTELQRCEREDLSWVLSRYLSARQDAYFSADMFVYYQEGNRRRKVSPDLFVCFGVPKQIRRVYKTWEEGHGLDWVMEIVSSGTWREDIGKKRVLYAQDLGVQEYFVYDPEGEYLEHPLLQFRNQGGVLKLVAHADPMRQRSELLGLDLVVEPLVQNIGKWRVDFALPNGTRLLRSSQSVEQQARALQAAEEREKAAEIQLQQEANARQELERENERLREQLRQLQGPAPSRTTES